jgi:hypothetical protein
MSNMLITDVLELSSLLGTGGWTLLVKPDECVLCDVPLYEYPGDRAARSVAHSAFDALRPALKVLTRDGVPPVCERSMKVGTSWLCGWKELGLPDPAPGEYWCFAQ